MRFFALLLLIAVTALRFNNIGPFERMQLFVFDLYQNIQPREVRPSDMGPGVPGVVIVDLDEESLARVGQWPWPRNTIADLVQNLMAYGAVAVGFDVFFVEEDRLSPAQFVKTVRNLDPAVAEVLNALPSNDVILAEILRNSRAVLGQTALSTVTIGELPSVANPGTAGPKMDLPAGSRNGHGCT